MEPEPRKSPIRFYEIDLLRFLAAMSVVVYHYTYRGYAEGNYSPIPFLALGHFTRYGYLGVELFFIISGYVVLLSAQGKTVRQFFLSRITRLYPAFWVACSLTFLVKRIWGVTTSDIGMSSLLHVTFGQYVYNMTMLQEFFNIFNLDSACWSLTIEITFYFLISLLIGYKLMDHIDWFILFWLVFAVLPDRFHAGSAFDTLLFPKYAPYFSAGMLFYLLQSPVGRTVKRWVLLLVSYLLAIKACKAQTLELAGFYHDDFSWKITSIFVTLFFVVVFLVSFRKINLSRFTGLAWLGALTYPLYLIHSDIAFILFHRIGGNINKYLLVIGTIILMLLIASIIHIFVEKRFSKPMGGYLERCLNALGAHKPVVENK